MEKSVSEWAETCFSPSVIVDASEHAKLLLEQNGLSLMEFVQPFRLQPASTSARVRINDKVLKFQNSAVNFVLLKDIGPFNNEQINEYLSRVILPVPSESETPSFEELSTGGLFRRFLNKIQDPTPWLTTYRQSLNESLRFQEYSYLDHPIGCLMFVSSDDVEDATNLARKLFNLSQLSIPFQNQVYDPSMVYMTCIVLENGRSEISSAENHQRSKECLDAIKNIIPRCTIRITSINSFSPDSMSENNDWQLSRSKRSEAIVLHDDIKNAHVRVGSEQTNGFSTRLTGDFSNFRSGESTELFDDEVDGSLLPRGSLISNLDTHGLMQAIWECILEGMIPSFERNLQSLQLEISKHRSGLKNQIKLFFGRSNRPAQARAGADTKSTNASGDVVYTFSQLESQIRRVADMCFLLRDYESALGYYKMILSDYKSDKAFSYYASTCEMIGICLFLTRGDEKKMEEHFEFAFNYFHMAGLSKAASNSALWSSSCFRAIGDGMRSSKILLKASSKEKGIFGALLMEQASYCYLYCKPPLKRKFAFYLIMAAHSFQDSKYLSHAASCYSVAIQIYRRAGWRYSEDHVHLALARLSYREQEYDDAIDYFLPVLTSGRHEEDRQTSFIKEFLVILNVCVL